MPLASSSVDAPSSIQNIYRRGMNTNNSKENDVENRNDDNNPHLLRLLKQLRPFQREAYDYATKGIVSSRQFHAPDIKTKNKKRAKSQDDDNKKVVPRGRP